ncbi:GNAT family N-acetyltransferase [Flavobacterium sp.]|uniref:GNAT family N-acetyltransferase n=1 Tax=Flavobacterium sp. TaxID=239 RepID=UPI002FDC8044
MNEKHYETARLWFEPLQANVAEFIRELLNSQGWLQFIGNRNVNTLADAEAYIQKVTTHPDLDYYTVFLKENRRPIGILTVIQRDYLDFPDLGFAFLPHYSGKGYAFEAAACLLTELTKTHETLFAVTMKENQSSIQLLERLGFVREREVEQGGVSLWVYAYSKPHSSK